jgi:hypothetical protein
VKYIYNALSHGRKPIEPSVTAEPRKEQTFGVEKSGELIQEEVTPEPQSPVPDNEHSVELVTPREKSLPRTPATPKRTGHKEDKLGDESSRSMLN